MGAQAQPKDTDMPQADEEHVPSIEESIEAALTQLKRRPARALPLDHLSQQEQHLRTLEAFIFAANAPVGVAQLRDVLPGADIGALMPVLETRWQERGMVLQRAGGKYHFVTAPDLTEALSPHLGAPKARLSSAAMETLAIIAYHQPCTRTEIEAVRGVAVQKAVLDVLIEKGWVALRGRRASPGRPMTFGVTDQFFSDLSLEGADDLPAQRELAAAGLLSPHLPENFQVALPQEELPDGEVAPNELPEDDSFVTDYLDDDDT